MAPETDAGSARPEPRWPALLAVLALGALYADLPPELVLPAPRWLLLAIVSVLLVPTVAAHRLGRHELNQALGYALNAVVTAAMVASLALLVRGLPEHRTSPTLLLRSAAGLWVTNILVFACWYWRLDAGGPHARDQRRGHEDGAFLFPQMAMHPDARAAAGEEEWSPHFVDYLFLAFNASTAFSPADVAVLSRWAKALMMIQSLISLLVVALLAARAVNVL